MKTKVKVPAKINLTLKIIGEKDGYHLLDSLVASVNIYDKIIVKKRKDDRINIVFLGYNEKIVAQNANVYKTAMTFKQKFNTTGVDITVKRKIPDGAGLGSSSADISGTLNALKKLFNVKDDMEELAQQLGSDTVFMLKGGYARLLGRGERVEFLNVDTKYYFVGILCEEKISTKECFAEFDKNSCFSKQTDNEIKLFLSDKEKFLSNLNNDLITPAITLSSRIDTNLKLLKDCAFNMTGSGSMTYAVFTDKKMRDAKYNQLKKKVGKRNLLKLNTVLVDKIYQR